MSVPNAPKKYLIKRELRDHIRRVHNTAYDYPCDNCELKFKVRRVLLKHKETVHSQTNELFTCKICEQQMSSVSKLNKHNVTHEEKVKCDQCSIFVQPRRLRAHIWRKHISSQRAYNCNTCGKILKSKVKLKLHIRIHTSRMKPFNCLTCNMEFFTSRSLQIHQITHTSEQPYKCLVDYCDKSFNNSGSLHHHKEGHHKESGETNI